MSERRLNVLCVVGTSAASSATHAVIGRIAQGLSALGDDVDIFDPNEESLPLFNPQSSYSFPGFVSLKERVERADAYVFGTPDYHGSVSSTFTGSIQLFRSFGSKIAKGRRFSESGQLDEQEPAQTSGRTRGVPKSLLR